MNIIQEPVYQHYLNFPSIHSCSLTGIKKPVNQYGPAGGAPAAPAQNGKGGDDDDDDDDDDFDLFGSEDEEEVSTLSWKIHEDPCSQFYPVH